MAASSSSSSRNTRAHADGSWTIAVPTPTTVAPASSSSSASAPVHTPPVPMIGRSGKASLTCHTHRTATGLIAGPDSAPYVPASAGRIVTVSMAIPSSALTSESPAAPAAAQVPATATMSVTSGDSLANTGMSYLAPPRTAATTPAAACGSRANTRPASSALGQERLTSMAVTPAASDSLAARSAYSRTVWPPMETITRAPRDSSQGRSRWRNASMPGPCSPTEFSRPLGVSASRGAGLPVRGSAMIDFVISAPILATSVNWAISRPAPAQPAAASTGLGNSTPPSLARMATGMAGFRDRALPARRADGVERDRAHVIPSDQVTAEYRPVDARAHDPGHPVGSGHRQHAAHADPGPAGHRHVHQRLHEDLEPARDQRHLAQHRHRRARVDHLGAGLGDDLLQHPGHRAAGAERAIRGGKGGAPAGPTGSQRAEHPVGARRAEQEVDQAAAVPQPRGERVQRRAAVADAEQQAARRVARHREGPAERSHHVQRVPGPQPGQPPGPRAAGLEHELHRAAVIGPYVVHGERAPPQHRGLRPADGDRDELAGPEPGD